MIRVRRSLSNASIASYLSFLAAAIAIPLIAFAAALLALLESYDHADLQAKTASDARALGRIVERHLSDMTSTLRLLAVFPELEQADLRGFQNRTQEVLLSDSIYLLLVDESGRQLVNTRVPYGAELGRTSNMDDLQTALDKGTVVVSSIFFGQTGKEWVFNVILPLPAEMRHIGAALILTQSVTRIQTLLSEGTLPELWSAAIIDQNEFVVASGGANGPMPTSAFPDNVYGGFNRYSDFVEFTQNGEAMISGYARLAGFPWTVALWGPVASVQASILSTWRVLAIGSALFIVLSLFIAYLVGRQLSQSIRQLSRMAERIGLGEITPPVTTKLNEVNQIARALSTASFERGEAEDRVHLVMRELVHRNKNILTLVLAILRQLARQTTTKEEFQVAADLRLKGLAQSIDLLAQENWTGLPMRTLIEQHLKSGGIPLDQLIVEGEDFPLNAAAVQNFGLILHELATNSIKYGAFQDENGRVRLSWRNAGNREGEPGIFIEWKEEGGPEIQPPLKSGFGSIIVERHAAAAFNAEITVEYRPEGFYWALHAPWSAVRGEETGASPTDNRVENAPPVAG